MWMYESSHPEVTQILRDVLDLRYRLAPTFYSLYVAEYQRKGWPLLKVRMRAVQIPSGCA